MEEGQDGVTEKFGQRMGTEDQQTAPAEGPAARSCAGSLLLSARFAVYGKLMPRWAECYDATDLGHRRCSARMCV